MQCRAIMARGLQTEQPATREISLPLLFTFQLGTGAPLIAIARLNELYINLPHDPQTSTINLPIYRTHYLQHWHKMNALVKDSSLVFVNEPTQLPSMLFPAVQQKDPQKFLHGSERLNHFTKSTMTYGTISIFYIQFYCVICLL